MACDLEVERVCPQEREILRSPSSQISRPGGGLQALWLEQPVQVQLLEIFTGTNKNLCFYAVKYGMKGTSLSSLVTP